MLNADRKYQQATGPTFDHGDNRTITRRISGDRISDDQGADQLVLESYLHSYSPRI